ncbi:MAG: hypothetical protein WCG30_03170 [Candidatus Saccharibacteria bacterium]
MSPNNTDEQKAVPADLNNNIPGLKPSLDPDLTASSSMSEPSMPEAPVMPSSDESDMKIVPNPNSPMGSESTNTTSPVASMAPDPINSDNSASIEPQQPSAFVPAQPQMQVHKPIKNHSKTIILITSLILLILLGVLAYVFLKTKK